MLKYLDNPLYKNFFYIVLTSIFNAACNFFSWMLAARLYSVRDVGVSTALISSLGLVILLSRLGFDTSIIRFFPTYDKAKVFNTSLAITTAASLIVGVVCLLLLNFAAPSLAFAKDQSYTAIFLLIGVANSVSSITANAFVASRKADHYMYQSLLLGLRIPFLIPLAFLGSFGIFGALGLAYLIASAMALYFLGKQLSGLSLTADREFIRESFKFSSRNYVSSILFTAPMLILPILVLNLLGEAEAAKYYVSMAIGNSVLIIPDALGTSLFVEGSHGESLKRNTVRAGLASFVLLTPVVLILYIFGGFLLGLLKEEYTGAFELLRILTLSSFLVTVYSLFIPIENVSMRVEVIVKINLVRFVLLLVLSYMLMTRYGILGAGYAWMITYGVLGLMIAWVVKKEKWV